MPRPIFLPLSGRDRMHARYQLRLARQEYAVKMREAQRAREAAGRYQREADRAFCEAWNAAMFAGGPAQPSPTIQAAIGASFGRLVVKCSQCGRESVLPLASIHRPPDTLLWQLEASLNCEACRRAKGRRVQAYIIGLRCTDPDDPAPPAAASARR